MRSTKNRPAIDRSIAIDALDMPVLKDAKTQWKTFLALVLAWIQTCNINTFIKPDPYENGWNECSYNRIIEYRLKAFPLPVVKLWTECSSCQNVFHIWEIQNSVSLPELSIMNRFYVARFPVCHFNLILVQCHKICYPQFFTALTTSTIITQPGSKTAWMTSKERRE
jgi:hypothetical protein